MSTLAVETIAEEILEKVKLLPLETQREILAHVEDIERRNLTHDDHFEQEGFVVPF